MNIPFNRDEFYLLAMTNALTRREAIDTIQDSIKNDDDDDIKNLKIGTIEKLDKISDDDFLWLDIEEYAEQLRDMYYEQKMIDLGIMDEDGNTLRKMTDEDKKALEDATLIAYKLII